MKTANKQRAIWPPVYTRDEAIADGLLINLNVGKTDDVVKQHYDMDVDVTETVWCMIQAAAKYQDINDVINSVLYMSRTYYRKLNDSSNIFSVMLNLWGEEQTFHLKASFGPSENGIVLTISLPRED